MKTLVSSRISATRAADRPSTRLQQAFEEARLTMKRMFARLAGVAAGVLLAAALATPPASAETVLRVGEADHGDIDPHQGTLFADSILQYNIYDTLVYPALDGSGRGIVPHLAERIDVDATGTLYTVKLKPNVKFHSGNTMSADDVVFSMNRVLAIKKGYSFLFDGWVEKSTAKDPLTVEFKLTKPYGAFYASLVRLGIVDAKTVLANKQAGPHGEFGDYGAAWLLLNSAGTGAYRVVSHERTVQTELRKFKDYFLGVGPKAPDVVRFRYAMQDLTVVTLFRQGELDLVRPLVQPETKRELLKISGVTLAPEAGVQSFFLMMNNAKAPFDDPACRRAFAYAVDYESIHSLEDVTPELRGAKPAKGPLMETHPGFDPSLGEFAKRDLAKAKAELANCKYKPGAQRIQIVWMSANRKTERFALLLQNNWKDLGFESDIEPRVWAHFTEQVAKPETAPMVVPIYVSTPVPDPDSYLFQSYHSSRHGQWAAASYFKDAEVDRLLEQGRGMPVGPERTALYQKANQRIRELQPVIFGLQQVNLIPKRDTFVWPNLERPKMNTG
ncbi:MAG: ABC transporter substrate-binding protein, partial [Alphaproteobacteria bacterium]|nr:ABC transporter substrate-binding protein [Alphaproteobacteria bacterium]